MSMDSAGKKPWRGVSRLQKAREECSGRVVGSGVYCRRIKSEQLAIRNLPRTFFCLGRWGFPHTTPSTTWIARARAPRSSTDCPFVRPGASADDETDATTTTARWGLVARISRGVAECAADRKRNSWYELALGHHHPHTPQYTPLHALSLLRRDTCFLALHFGLGRVSPYICRAARRFPAASTSPHFHLTLPSPPSAL